MKNFAVALNNGTPAERNAITKHLADSGYGYWHWVDDFWIVRTDVETAKSLYLTLLEEANLGKETVLVFEFETPINFWGFAPKKAWDWMKKIGTPSQ